MKRSSIFVVLFIAFAASTAFAQQLQTTVMPISGDLGNREVVHQGNIIHRGTSEPETIRFGPSDRRSCMGNCNGSDSGAAVRAEVGPSSVPGFTRVAFSAGQFAIQTPTESHPRGSGLFFEFRAGLSNGLLVTSGNIRIGHLEVSDHTQQDGKVVFDNITGPVRRELGNGLTVALDEIEFVSLNWARYHLIHVFSTDGSHAVDNSIGLVNFALGTCTPCPTGSVCYSQGADLVNRLIVRPFTAESVLYRLQLETGLTLWGTAWRQIVEGNQRARYLDIARGIGFQVAESGGEVNLYRNGVPVMLAAPRCQ